MIHRSRHSDSASRTRRRRAFTLVEVLVAALIASFVLGAIWASLGQMVSVRSTTRARMHAYLRADTALNTIRRDVASVLRSEDLFWTKFRITDGVAAWGDGLVARDELLVFSTRLAQTRPIYDQGEGMEYETQYRITEDAYGTVLWQRRDAVPDEYYDGGGVVLPIVDGIVGLNIEATDGYSWHSTWDSDFDGLPMAVRITVIVPIDGRTDLRPVMLRTLVAVDRVPEPFDVDLIEEEEAQPQPQTPPQPSGTPPATGPGPGGPPASGGGRPTGGGRGFGGPGGGGGRGQGRSGGGQ